MTFRSSGAIPGTSPGNFPFPAEDIHRPSSGAISSSSLQPFQLRDAAAPASSGGRGAGGGAGLGKEYSFRLLCFDRNTGKLIWDREATKAVPHEGYHGRYGSFASNTPVTDGKHVVAFFGSRGVYVYDLDGKLAWQKKFAPMEMRLGFGEGVAPVLDGNSLYLKFDQEKGSHLVVLDKNSGKELWRVDRDEVSSWSPPLIVTHDGRKQVVVSASNKVRSYDASTGKLIWESAGLGHECHPGSGHARWNGDRHERPS